LHVKRVEERAAVEDRQWPHASQPRSEETVTPLSFQNAPTCRDRCTSRVRHTAACRLKAAAGRAHATGARRVTHPLRCSTDLTLSRSGLVARVVAESRAARTARQRCLQLRRFRAAGGAQPAVEGHPSELGTAAPCQQVISTTFEPLNLPKGDGSDGDASAGQQRESGSCTPASKTAGGRSVGSGQPGVAEYGTGCRCERARRAFATVTNCRWRNTRPAGRGAFGREPTHLDEVRHPRGRHPQHHRSVIAGDPITVRTVHINTHGDAKPSDSASGSCSGRSRSRNPRRQRDVAATPGTGR
jgi:hypothetical protein